MYKLDNKIYEKCNNSILITGGARNGTTILGKIFHSFINVEYIYEPPMLFSLFALIDTLCEKDWRLLYETYSYEEFLINAIAGRNLNCNRSDDSSIYNVKTELEIDKRQSRSLSKIEAEKIANKSLIVWKMPDIVPYLSTLIKYYPKVKIILITRNPSDVLNSLLKKEWFSDDALQNSNQIWPNRLLNNFKIPFWVKNSDESLWLSYNLIDRCAYYYLRMATIIHNRNSIIISYDNLIQYPDKTISGLANNLHLKYGLKTKDIIKTIKKTNINRDDKIMLKVNEILRNKIQNL